MSHHDALSLDKQGYIDSPVHRLDPRAKVIVTLVYIVTVVSYPKYSISPMFPFILYPMALAILGFMRLKSILKQIALAMPFLVLIGLFNPILDRRPLLEINGFVINGGWVSFASILLRGLLCISAVTVLIGTTSFPRIAEALGALGVPRVLVVQLMFLYRYLFLLVAESQRMNSAKALRSGASKTSLSTAASMLSVLLTRTMDRGDSIWMAMKARGFSGEMKTAQRAKWRSSDTIFVVIVIVACILLRIFPITQIIGDLGRTL